MEQLDKQLDEKLDQQLNQELNKQLDQQGNSRATSLNEKSDVAIEIRGERFWLMPERSAYWERTKTLLCSDLHWGKAEAFQKAGVGVSSRVLNDDLNRLSRAIERSGAELVYVLGDLVHSDQSVTQEVIETVASWRAQFLRVQFHLIRGNHDRRFILPPSWHFTESRKDLVQGDFVFAHEIPEKMAVQFAWCGHVHPVTQVTGRGDSVRVPCFRIDSSKALLPAFSAFTGGFKVDKSDRNARLFAVTDVRVIEV